MLWPFKINQKYNRRADIHQEFGGQQQGGISTPTKVRGIFIFTGHGALKVGYNDRFFDDGSLDLTGEGQLGDQKMQAGNLAILNHAINGKDLLVFYKPESREKVEFRGLFACAGWHHEDQPDTTRAIRKAIVFKLMPIDSLEREAQVQSIDLIDADVDLAALRKLAIAAAQVGQTPQPSSTSVYIRSGKIRSYALKRAAGHCEGCASPAPFKTENGRPFLEVHHIAKLSDGGPDHPDYVAAVCPNCHREAHFGIDQKSLNDRLVELRKLQAGWAYGKTEIITA